MESLAASNDRLLGHALWRALYRVTGVPPVAVVAAALLTLLTAAVVVYSLENLCLFLAFAYPALKSFESVQSDDVPEQRFWLSYWIVYGSLHFVHQVTDRVLYRSWRPTLFGVVGYFQRVVSYRVPYYPEFKILFLLWCFLPQFRGSTYVYQNLIRPAFVVHRDRIDRSLRKAKTHYDDAHRTLKSASSSLVPTLASSLTNMAVQALTRIEERQKRW